MLLGSCSALHKLSLALADFALPQVAQKAGVVQLLLHCCARQRDSIELNAQGAALDALTAILASPEARDELARAGACTQLCQLLASSGEDSLLAQNSLHVLPDQVYQRMQLCATFLIAGTRESQLQMVWQLVIVCTSPTCVAPGNMQSMHASMHTICLKWP